MSEPTGDASSAERSTLRFDDRVVIVTGASSGLGVQFARALDAVGAHVVLVARREAQLRSLARECKSALVVPCDVTREGSAQDVADAAVDAFGRIDGLVNNAGVNKVADALEEDLRDFRRIIEVNLVAPFALSQATARAMKDSGGGAIVNVSSISGFVALRPLPEAAYVSSKGGLNALTRELAVQWARYNIRVNALAPGPLTTPMTADTFEPGGRLGEWMEARAPAARPGRDGDLDTILLALLHPSNSYLTGQTIVVDGGLTVC